jgi:hypothetical protein
MYYSFSYNPVGDINIHALGFYMVPASAAFGHMARWRSQCKKEYKANLHRSEPNERYAALGRHYMHYSFQKRQPA